MFFKDSKLEYRTMDTFCSILLFVNICIAVGDPIIKTGRVGVQFIGLTPPNAYAYPKKGLGPTSSQDPDFHLNMLWSFFVFNDLTWWWQLFVLSILTINVMVAVFALSILIITVMVTVVCFVDIDHHRDGGCCLFCRYRPSPWWWLLFVLSILTITVMMTVVCFVDIDHHRDGGCCLSCRYWPSPWWWLLFVLSILTITVMMAVVCFVDIDHHRDGGCCLFCRYW